MAESRLPKLGTVFTRIRGLMRGGAMKHEDRPLWYDIYEAFPPKLAPVADRPIVFKEIEEIFYPEDIIRAQFYKRFASPGVINLVSPTGHTMSQRFVETFLELTKDNQIPRNELFNATVEKLLSQGVIFGDKPRDLSKKTTERQEAPSPPPTTPSDTPPATPSSTNSQTSFGQTS